MTDKEKRTQIKQYDDEFVKSYLEQKGYDVEELDIDIRYDGYINNWKGFSGDIVSYTFDQLQIYQDLHDAIDDIYAIFTSLGEIESDTFTQVQLEQRKLDKAHYIIKICQKNILNPSLPFKLPKDLI